LAKAAHGSMRDALSLLDQAIASSDNALNSKDVKNILGYTQQDFAIKILQALAALEAPALINLSRQIGLEGGQFSYVLDELLEYLHQITICQNLPDSSMFLSASDEIIELAKQLTPQNVQLFYQIGIKSIQEMHLAPSLLIGFEMMLLRMFTFQPATTIPVPTLKYETLEPNPMPNRLQSSSAQTKLAKPVVVPVTMPEEKNEQLDKVVEATSGESWESILQQIKLTGLAQNAAENAEMVRKNGSEIALHIAKGHQSLFTANIIQRIEQALTSYFRETIKINLDFTESVQSTPAQKKHIASNLNQKEAEISLQEDPFLQQLKHVFSAEQVKNSVEPL
jgi:DNA polymerase III subunit gamma/tau